ncbi:DUF2023 family protein [Methanococcoides sp. NM1]|uniref:DUF2023 family protein n=1 Tax=Methanococcoides sp. NM1 TaxID=1201013 RepID=UPI001AEF65A3|nr:DUF2023 family protein [Methanococcoides sp. NM1]
MKNVTEELLRTYFDGNMQVFRHHMYEYQKGLRDLILHTTTSDFQDEMVRILEKNNIAYLIHSPADTKVNVFFGDERCINVLKSIGKKNRSECTDEEDFILGIMLGYDRLKQCERFLERNDKNGMVEVLIG